MPKTVNNTLTSVKVIHGRQ